MSIAPIITFKAGICDFEPPNVKPKATPGYVYLYEEDELIQFCWRPRSVSMSSPELKLAMVPEDGRFIPYQKANPSPTNGRIFVLKFQSSAQRYFFWLQAKSQHTNGDPSWFSQRDLKIGDIVDRLLQGVEVNAREEIASVSNNNNSGAGDEDAEMEDAGPEGHGPSATGGEPPASDRNEPSGSGNEGQGGQSTGMPTDAAAAVQNFLRSMQGNQNLQGQQAAQQGQIYTTLPDLLPPSTTIPVIDSTSPSAIDHLLRQLPPALLLLSQQAESEPSVAEPNAETVGAAIDAMSIEQKRELLRKVLRSPQFVQSLSSLTGAIREGGLPSIADALKTPVENGGMIPNGSVPLGGGDAVEAFIEGVRKSVSEEREGDSGGTMETD